MRMLHPDMLYWSLLLVGVALVYLFRRRARALRVSTLPFFQALAREHQESPWLRRLKRLLSFLLAALVVAGLVGALARPIVAPPAGALKTVVIAVDRSASMAARDDSGRDRLREGLDHVRRRLVGLPSGVGVMLLAYDRRPEILLPRTLDRRAVLRALDRLRVRPLPGDAGPALALAQRLAAVDAPAAVWWVSDEDALAPHPVVNDTSGPVGDGLAEGAPVGAAPDALAKTEPPTLSTQPVADSQEVETRIGPAAPVTHIACGLYQPRNAGITALRIRPAPLDRNRYEVYVQAEATGPAEAPLEVELAVRLDGRLTQIRALDLTPDTPHRLLLPLDATQGATLSIGVTLAGDALPLDDYAYARVPPPEPLRVLWVAEEPSIFAELALESLGDGQIEIFHCKPAAYPPKAEGESFHVLLADGWAPDAWPAEKALILVDPPTSLGPIQVAPFERGPLPVERPRAVDSRHPLLYGVASPRLRLGQTAMVDDQRQLQPLWVGPWGPALLAGEIEGRRVVVMPFAPDASGNLPLSASYPLLLGNAIYWTAEVYADARAGRNHRTGTLVEIPTKRLRWETPDARGETTTRWQELPSPWVELDRIGLWSDGAEMTGSANLLSSRETLLPARAAGSPSTGSAEDGTTAEAEAARVIRPWIPRGDWTAGLLALALVVLLCEHWLFHQRAVY